MTIVTRRLLLPVLPLLTALSIRTPADSIAVGKPYTLLPEPNYGLCTDPDDAKQLTDGQLVDPARVTGQIWRDKGCVGWSVGTDAEVVIDLGEVCPIDQVVVFSGAGPGAEVYLPNVLVAVSDEGETFHVVRRIDTSKWSHVFRKRLEANDLKTRGRYVLVRLIRNFSKYVFVDEITVEGGTHDPAAVVLSDETMGRLVLDLRAELQKRLMNALDRLTSRVLQSESVLAEEIAALRRQIEETPTTAAGKLRKLDPATAEDLRRKTVALQRKAARRWKGNDLIVWASSPWEEILPQDFPGPGEKQLARLDVLAGRKEYESSAFMVSNPSDQERSIRVVLKESRLSGPGEWRGSVTLRRVRFVSYPERLTLADALPRLDEELVIPSWESRQVWLQIHTGDTSPGTYTGALALNDGKGFRREIGLSIRVLPVEIPAELPVVTHCWQYVDSIATLKGVEREAVADLAAHYANVAIVQNHALPRPLELDDQGRPVGELDFTKLDASIELHRPIIGKGIGWFPSMTFRKELAKDSPEYRSHQHWIKALVEHLKTLGIGYDDFFVYPVDECIRGDFITSGKMIRSLDPKVRIFADPMMRDADDLLRAASPYVDIWSPPVGDHPQLPLLRGERQTLWCYTVNRRMKHPYSAYRIPLWQAFQTGATGCAFWCYAVGDSWKNADMWKDGSFLYAVIYTLTGAPEDVSRAEKIIPSKRWEAWREGVEDYTYLFMLRERIEANRAKPQMRDQVEAGQTILDAAVKAVVNDPEDLSRADENRRRVLQALVGFRG